MKEKAHSVVVNYVKEGIVNGTLHLGDRLPPERELGELLGVSRNAVREGIKELSVLGIVGSEQGSGNYIQQDFMSVNIELMKMMYATNYINYDDITDFRYALEMLAIISAMKNISEQDLKKIEECVRIMDETDDDVVAVAQDKRFHDILTNASGNPLLISSYRALSAVVEIYMEDTRSKFTQTEDGYENVAREHRKIAAALREKDLEKGREGIDGHFRALRQLEH